MKQLFDENLSHKLVRLLDDLFPNSIHVRDVGLKAAIRWCGNTQRTTA